ncbi:MAG: flagellar biosynthesis protein FlhF [Thermodesulfobacteriota bacterium]|jgi:flagellar biosynthesis protein FlhF|nr:flagellar biosynthesis protein FlhF [Thermodesulfobacteriota bacterium]
MLVKVFESENMASALKKVKETLGPDALILSTRTIRKGGLGVLGKPILEVTAAVEPSGEAARSVGTTTPVAMREKKALASSRGDRRRLSFEDELSYDEIWAENRGASTQRAVPEATPRRNPREFDTLRGEIDELKSIMRGFINEARTPVSASPETTGDELAAAVPSRRRARSGANGTKGNEEGLDGLVALLRERGIDHEAAETIVRFACQRASDAQRRDPEVMRAIFADVIGDLIRVGAAPPEQKQQRRLALIGPTGVGKTTTIAKLAADHLLHGGKSLAMVTIDTFRIAAVEQLKVYGEIMNVPVDVVVSPKQLRGVLNRHRDKDLILIDTAGRSPRDETSLNELADILTPELGTENHLVLSAATRDVDLYDAVARFGQVAIHNLIFTKIDECSQAGALFNVHLRHNFPIAYLTNGQRVPEDILVADSKKIARMIMG